MNKPINDAIKLLRNPLTIRKRSREIFDRTLNGESAYFKLNLNCMGLIEKKLIEHINQYQSVEEIPFHSRWRHFNVGEVDRLSLLKATNGYPSTPLEQGRVLIELAIVSVLLDAGAGDQWSYHEKATDEQYTRSEGLAVASINMYQQGLFSPDHRLSVTSEGLNALTLIQLQEGFQSSQENPLLAVEGRLILLKELAKVMSEQTDVFGPDPRLGLFYDHLLKNASSEQQMDASKVLSLVLETFSSIWPGRLTLEGQNLGDVWHHSALSGTGEEKGLIPFHKLSQWLSYSLLEPFIWQGYSITNLDKLTGLAEYRNGGLFLDFGVLELKNPTLSEDKHQANSELIIEWRALTLCLLDNLWKNILNTLQLSKESFPLVKLLEAGTWKAGREIAFEKRANGAPPLTILSDGTVF